MTLLSTTQSSALWISCKTPVSNGHKWIAGNITLDHNKYQRRRFQRFCAEIDLAEQTASDKFYRTSGDGSATRFDSAKLDQRPSNKQATVITIRRAYAKAYRSHSAKVEGLTAN
jgi:hypothetical protein